MDLTNYTDPLYHLSFQDREIRRDFIEHKVSTCTALVLIFSLAFLLIHRGAFLDKEVFSKMK